MTSTAQLPEASISIAGAPGGPAPVQEPLLQSQPKSQPGSVYFAGQATQYVNVNIPTPPESGPGAGPAPKSIYPLTFPTSAPEAGWTNGNQPLEGTGTAGPQEPRVVVAGGGGEPVAQQAPLAFSEASIRRAFIQKVFGILSAQLLLTAAVVLCFMYVPLLRLLAHESFIFWLASLYATASANYATTT